MFGGAITDLQGGAYTSYKIGDTKIFEALSEFPAASFDFKAETYKDYSVPVFRRGADGFGADAATFGMVPRKRILPGVKIFDTMNARAESVGEKRIFSGAWKKLQLCLIPCESFFEPDYGTGKPVRRTCLAFLFHTKDRLARKMATCDSRRWR
ncbi:SOS response-associated peptidase family protein [Caballeronia mineralivorans]|uniref:SOS response-associated peptidase family protein n=1 Tax=Caballeronia mineralivorans TaxID=2010198 RepID=UPI00069FC4A9|nr:SOS response-associated peptidase family protein [Caballeronia mineralivorans]